MKFQLCTEHCMFLGEKKYVEVPTCYCSPWFCFSSSVFWFAVPKSGVNGLGELHSDLSSIHKANKLCNYLIQSQSNIIWKLMVPDQPHVFKRVMKLSDMQLNVICLQRIEEFEKNSLEDSSKSSSCKNTAGIFPWSTSRSLKFRQKGLLLKFFLNSWLPFTSVWWFPRGSLSFWMGDPKQSLTSVKASFQISSFLFFIFFTNL